MKTANRKKGPDTVFENYLNVELQSAFWQSQAVRPCGPGRRSAAVASVIFIYAEKLLAKLTLIAFGLVLLLANSTYSVACTCLPLSLEVEFENADYVFRAVVTATETIDIEDAGIIDFEQIGVELSYSARKALEMVKVTFDQIKNYKGDASEVKYLFIPSSARLCNGPTPEIGVSGTFFTDKSGHIPGCGPSWMGQSHIQGFTIDQVKKLSIQYQEKCKKSFEQTPAAGTPQLAQERACR